MKLDRDFTEREIKLIMFSAECYTDYFSDRRYSAPDGLGDLHRYFESKYEEVKREQK